MRIARLSLKNFRNYPELDLKLPIGTILLQGDNAQGKTNLLEAIYYLATASSPRAEKEQDLVRWGTLDEGESAALRGEIQGEEESTRVEIHFLPARNSSGNLARLIRINGVKKRLLDLWGRLRVVAFIPEDVDLVAGPPTLRRRFLDAAISQLDHNYFRATQQFEKVLTQRNHILKKLREGKGDKREIAFWDEKLAEAGSFLQEARQRFVADLEALAQGIHRDLTGGEETLRLVYRVAGLKETPAPVVIETAGPLEAAAVESKIRVGLFRNQLEALSREEIERGVTLFGPHRDDLGILANDIDLNVYGSRGQQRTAALALTLALVKYIHNKTGEQPVLLLDDVMSELDEARRTYLLSALADQEQVLITTTSLDFFPRDFQQKSHRLRVVAGIIEPLSSRQ